MRRAALIVVTVCVLAAAGCGGRGEQPTGESSAPAAGNVSAGPSESPGAAAATGVRGRVTGPDGAPLSNAAVSRFPADSSRPVTQEAGVTDGDGRYLWALSPGVWDVEISMPGHRTVKQRVTVVEGQWAQVDFTLQPS